MITDLPTAIQIAHEFSVAGLPKAVQPLPRRTLTLCQERGFLPTYVNQTENKSLMIEYSAANWYLATVFWPDGEIDLFFKQGTEITRWALTTQRYTVKLKAYFGSSALFHELNTVRIVQTGHDSPPVFLSAIIRRLHTS